MDQCIEGDGLSIEELLDVLSSKDCRLQSLDIDDLDLWGDDVGHVGPSKINNSITELRIGLSRYITAKDLIPFCTRFKSLSKLGLRCNNIQDLSPLATFLVGDNLQLQDLSLGECNIGENCIVDFFRHLPQMKSIQRIRLSENPFLGSNSWMDTLSNALPRTTSLENLQFGNKEGSKLERKGFYSRLEVTLSLNRAWRRHMENGDANKTLAANLWPLVLKRATKISYFSCLDWGTKPTLQSDVVFWLLRERMLPDGILAS